MWVPQAPLLPTGHGEEGQVIPAQAVVCYIGEDPETFIMAAGMFPFVLMWDTISVSQSCLLYKPPWKDSPEQRAVWALLTGHAET